MRRGVRHPRCDAPDPVAPRRDPPPEPRRAGLEAALRDLVSPLAGRGATSLEVPEGLDLDDETEQLIYRAAGEAIRNVERHAERTGSLVRVGTATAGSLEIVDDGVGFTPSCATGAGRRAT